MTGKNRIRSPRCMADWKRTSMPLRQNGNLQAACSKNGTVQTVIGGDAVNFTVMLTGGTTFWTARYESGAKKFIREPGAAVGVVVVHHEEQEKVHLLSGVNGRAAPLVLLWARVFLDKAYQRAYHVGLLFLRREFVILPVSFPSVLFAHCIGQDGLDLCMYRADHVPENYAPTPRH